MAETPRVGTPWHLWVIGAAVLSSTLGGVRDFALLLGPDVDYVHAQGWAKRV